MSHKLLQPCRNNLCSYHPELAVGRIRYVGLAVVLVAEQVPKARGRAAARTATRMRMSLVRFVVALGVGVTLHGATSTLASAGGRPLATTLAGANEVPGPG